MHPLTSPKIASVLYCIVIIIILITLIIITIIIITAIKLAGLLTDTHLWLAARGQIGQNAIM